MPTPLIIAGVLVIAAFLIWGVTKLQALDDQHDRRSARRASGSVGFSGGGYFVAGDGGSYFGGGSADSDGGSYSGGGCSGSDGGSCDGGGD